MKCETQSNVYFEEHKIGDSCEDRPLVQFTLSSKEAIETKKPIVHLTSRVHSGETPASYMLQGLLDKLTEFNDR